MGPVAELTATLLPNAPGLTVLTTSQEPLAISGEQVWPVPPLPLPSAVALFTARAGAHTGTQEGAHDTHSTEAAAVAELCRRLDGIPLALELAASRVRTIGVHGLVARLDDRFKLLAVGPRNAPDRQRTLRAVIDWSWGLLTAPERVVLRRLAVHSGSCALEAAEAVCAGDDDVPSADVFELLARLVDRSLVVLSDRPDGPRYRLLESVKEYCAEQLRAAGEFDAVRERHCRYYTELARRAGPLLRGPGQQHWLERLDGESANLRAALDFAVRHGAGERALRTVNALAWYWVLREPCGGGPPLPGRGARGRTRTHAGSRRGHGMAGGYRPAARRARRRPREQRGGDRGPTRPGNRPVVPGLRPDGIRRCRHRREPGEPVPGRVPRPRRPLGDSGGTERTGPARHGPRRSRRRPARRRTQRTPLRGDRRPMGLTQTVFPLAALSQITGDYAHAARLQRDGLAIAEQLGLWTEAAKRLCGLGRIHLLTGDHAQAREFHGRALKLAREQNLRSGEVDAEIGLGLGARQEGDHDLAEHLMRGLLAWFREVGYGPGSTLALAELGFVAELRGDADTARALHLEGFDTAYELGDPRAVALAVEGLVGAQAAAGRYGESARLLGAAAAARDSVGAPLPAAERRDVDRVTAVAREALGAAGFEAEFGRGELLNMTEARALATR